MVETEIVEYLDEHGIEYDVLEHGEEALTSEKAAELRGVPLDEMIKTMVFLDDNREVVIAVVPANKKVDLGSLKEEANIGSLKFADEDVIEDKMGYTVGAIPPFFPDEDYPIYMDSKIFWNDQVNFSSGVPEAGIEVELSSFRKIMEEFGATKAPVAEDP
ncbi:MAG: aminoacyl-tRNA deacylase [Halobacteriaceae archaeon]